MLNHRLEKPVEACAKIYIQKDTGSLEEKLGGRNLKTFRENKRLTVLVKRGYLILYLENGPLYLNSLSKLICGIWNSYTTLK